MYAIFKRKKNRVRWWQRVSSEEYKKKSIEYYILSEPIKGEHNRERERKKEIRWDITQNDERIESEKMVAEKDRNGKWEIHNFYTIHAEHNTVYSIEISTTTERNERRKNNNTQMECVFKHLCTMFWIYIMWKWLPSTRMNFKFSQHPFFLTFFPKHSSENWN